MNPAPVFATQSFFPAIGISEIVLFSFYFAAAAYVIFSGIFYYHWQSYGTDAKVTWITYITYLVTTVPLMILMGILAVAI